MPHPISIQLYTVRNLTKIDFAGTIRQIAEIGYAAIEGGPGPMPLEEFKRFIGDLGIYVSSNWARPNRENVNKIVEQAQALGYKHIINGYSRDQFKTIDDVKRNAEQLAEMHELIKPHGLTFCVHNHWWEFETIDGRLMYEILMERAPNLPAELDMYWASNFGQVDVPQQIAKYRNRIPLLHVKDGPLIKDQPNTAVGQGKLDIAACIEAADPNVLKYLVVEMDDCATDLMTAVRDSYEWLERNGYGTGKK